MLLQIAISLTNGIIIALSSDLRYLKLDSNVTADPGFKAKEFMIGKTGPILLEFVSRKQFINAIVKSTL